jgi:radical SAM/Cys-rich protein
MAIKQRTKSLQAQGANLADTLFQLNVLNGKAIVTDRFPNFEDKTGAIKPAQLEILQINIGKMCNQTCAHCHVDAGPDRKEMMSRDHLETCLSIAKRLKIPTIDITGGAPEMHPDFRWFVQACRAADIKVINRCNLTIIVSNPKYYDLPQFFAENKVDIVSSLPFYTKIRTDAQRGAGVFEDSIKALQWLNAVGYGKASDAHSSKNCDLRLDLVYNPTGAFLPAAQSVLEPQFKKELKIRYDIEFNSLFCITNMPISRYLDYLLQTNNYHDYMESLVNAFNLATINGLMCRNTLSVSYDGFMYDCDFNQMLNLKVAAPITHIRDFDIDILEKRNIVLNQHCYGCTAGAGSSCGGEIVL